MMNMTFIKEAARLAFQLVTANHMSDTYASILTRAKNWYGVLDLDSREPVATEILAAMVLYGYIASSGLRTLINAKIDFSNNKNLVIISVVLTSGVSGMFLFGEAFSGVALALALGIILNLILKD